MRRNLLDNHLNRAVIICFLVAFSSDTQLCPCQRKHIETAKPKVQSERAIQMEKAQIQHIYHLILKTSFCPLPWKYDYNISFKHSEKMLITLNTQCVSSLHQKALDDTICICIFFNKKYKLIPIRLVSERITHLTNVDIIIYVFIYIHCTYSGTEIGQNKNKNQLPVVCGEKNSWFWFMAGRPVHL